MSTIYKVIAGDTLENIARKVYGIEQYATNILKSNPGLTEDLTPGIDLIIPKVPQRGVPAMLPQVASARPEEVAILIEGKRFRFWTQVRITRAIDTVDTIEFSAPFDPQSAEFRNLFRPFSFKDIGVTVGGKTLFTGTMVGVVPEISGQGKTIQVSGYSTPGVLNDCTASANAYPLEYNGQTLEEIAKAIIEPFGVTVVLAAPVGAVFKRVAAEVGDTILEFLSELAKQRNLILSSSPAGELLIQQSITAGSPVAKLKQGDSPVLNITPLFSPQEYYSHITGIEPVVIGLKGSQFTVKNPRLVGALRPHTFTARDTEAGTLKDAVEAKAGRMFGNMVSYSVQVATWRDPSGALWEPNTLVTLLAEGAMVYTEYVLLIRSIIFERDEGTTTAVLDLVIPESFNVKIPEVLPWDE